MFMIEILTVPTKKKKQQGNDTSLNSVCHRHQGQGFQTLEKSHVERGLRNTKKRKIWRSSIISSPQGTIEKTMRRRQYRLSKTISYQDSIVWTRSSTYRYGKGVYSKKT